MKHSTLTLLAVLCSSLAFPRPGFSASDLTVLAGGTLIIHTNVQVNAGSFTVEPDGAVNIDLGSKVTATNIVYSGTLTVSSNNLAVTAGQAYQLFSAPSYSGAFLTVNLPALASTLTWTNTLSNNGSIAVKSTPVSVQFGVMTYSGSQMVLSGSGGTANGTYWVLTTTNLSSSVTNWVISATNYFDGSGNFSFTNAINAGNPRQFFLLQAP